MSKGLGDKPWCMGIHFTLADIAVGCALGYLDFRFPAIDWRERHANLARLSRQAGAAPELHRHPAAGLSQAEQAPGRFGWPPPASAAPSACTGAKLCALASGQ